MYPIFLLIACSNLNLEMNSKPIVDPEVFLRDFNPAIIKNNEVYKNIKIVYKMLQNDAKWLEEYVKQNGSTKALRGESILNPCLQSSEAFFVGVFPHELETKWKKEEIKQEIENIVDIAIKCDIENEYTMIGILNFLNFHKYDMHNTSPDKVPLFFDRWASFRPLIKGKSKVPYPIASVFDKRKLLFKLEDAPSPLRSFIDYQRLPFIVLVTDCLIHYSLVYYQDYRRFIPIFIIIYAFLLWVIPKDNLYSYFEGLKSKRDSLFHKLESLEKNFIEKCSQFESIPEELETCFSNIKQDRENMKQLMPYNKLRFYHPLDLARQYKIDHAEYLSLKSLEVRLIETWERAYVNLLNKLEEAIIEEKD